MFFITMRLAAGVFVFFLALVIFMMITKKTGKSVLISAFAAIICFAVLLFVPVENSFRSFDTVEQAFVYRYHEELLTYAECDEGALCVAVRDEMNYFYYSFPRGEDGYKLPKKLTQTTVMRSSPQGVYLFEKFDKQTIILTKVLDSAYNGEAFKPCVNGYYSYTVVEGEVDYSALTCKGEKVSLV